MNLPFELAKERLDIAAVARAYGLDINRHGYARCPFHNEKSPSFHLRGQRFHCFGCGQSGDVFDLVGQLFHLDTQAALKKLNADFNLQLPLDRPLTERERRLALEEAKKRRAEMKMADRFESLVNRVYRLLAAYHRQLNERLKEQPKTPDEISNGYAEALRQIDYVSYLLDELDSGEPQRQSFVVKEVAEHRELFSSTAAGDFQNV